MLVRFMFYPSKCFGVDEQLAHPAGGRPLFYAQFFVKLNPVVSSLVGWSGLDERRGASRGRAVPHAPHSMDLSLAFLPIVVLYVAEPFKVGVNQ